MPDPSQLAEMQRERGTVKSCTELERLFKIDISPIASSSLAILKVTKTDPEIELYLHFVNKDKDPK